MSGSSAVKDKSVFCILVVDGEGGKGQRIIRRALGGGGSLALWTTEGKWRERWAHLPAKGLKDREDRDVFVREITGDSLKDWGGLSVTWEIPSLTRVNCYIFPPTVRKQEIIKITEQLIEAINNGDFEAYT